VLSRCLQFNLKQMTTPLISAHLKEILDVEAISAEPGALNLISRSASGSMRDALSLLDQAIAHGAGKVEEAQVRDMLGTVDLDYLFSLLEALLAGDAAGMLKVADDMAARSLSFDEALQELASLFTRLQVAQLAPGSVPDDLPERLRMLQIAEQLDPEFVQLAYQIAVHGRKELPLAPDEQSGFVMTLLRLHTFRPRPESSGNRRDPARTSGRQTGRVQVLRESVAPPPASRSEMPVAPVPVVKSGSVDESVPSTVQAVSELPSAEDGLVAASASPNVNDWHEILLVLKLGGMARELAQHCELSRVDGSQVALRLSPTHRHLQMRPAQDKVQQALSEYFGRPMQLTIDLQEVIGDTPAAAAQRRRKEQQDQAVASVEQDDFVRGVIDQFDATLIESSIKPL
jgi:DNA polymerase-3 subunit gamma/tau